MARKREGANAISLSHPIQFFIYIYRMELALVKRGYLPIRSPSMPTTLFGIVEQHHSRSQHKSWRTSDLIFNQLRRWTLLLAMISWKMTTTLPLTCTPSDLSTTFLSTESSNGPASVPSAPRFETRSPEQNYLSENARECIRLIDHLVTLLQRFNIQNLTPFVQCGYTSTGQRE